MWLLNLIQKTNLTTMKVALFLLSVTIFNISSFDLIPKNMNVDKLQSCPAYHEETRPILEEFLTNEKFQDERESIGLDSIEIEEVLYLEESTDKEACKELNFPRKTDDFLYTYYKSNHYYFIVNYFMRPTTKRKGNTIDIDTRSHSVLVYDQNFTHLVGVIF